MNAPVRPIRAGILTASDKGSQGQREDRSGDALQEMLENAGVQVVERVVVPDEQELIASRLLEWCEAGLDLILTTGGTGFSPRDVTPEATLAVIERPAPGMAEAMRLEGLKYTKKAMLSRGVAGIRGKTLILNMPGREKGAKQSLQAVIEVLDHAVEVLRGEAGDCGG